MELVAYPITHGVESYVSSKSFEKELAELRDKLRKPSENRVICHEYFDEGRVKVVDENGNGFVAYDEEDDGDRLLVLDPFYSERAAHNMWAEHRIPHLWDNLAKEYIRMYYGEDSAYIFVSGDSIKG